MKCLEKDRTRRYETANGLAMDLKRHLNNETVVARPPSSAYRFQKLVRRNRLAFAAAGAVAAALVSGLGVSVFLYLKENQAYNQAVAARHETDVARENERRQRQQAEGLVSFMVQDLHPALKDYGRLSLLQQVDEKTVSYYKGLPPELRNAKTELARADACFALSEILLASGDDKAADLKAREALALYQDLAQKHPEIPEATAGVLTIEWNAYAFGAMPPHSSAELDVFQQDNLRRWRVLLAKFPENPKVRTGLGGALWTRASFAAQRFNKPQEAVAVALELQKYVQEGMDRHPETKAFRAAYANALAVLAIAYQAVGDRAKSVQMSEEAVAFYDQALKEDPGNLNLLANAAEAAQNLSYRVASVSQKRSRDAEWVARERYRLLTALDPSNADWRYHFAMTHMMECYYLEGCGEIESARQAFKTFDALLQDLVRRGELQSWDADKPPQNCMDLARLAATAGDKTDARNQLAVGESRFQARYDKLPAGSFDRVQARIRWMNLKSGALFMMEDWGGLAEVAREALTLIADGLGQRPGDSELLLRRAFSQHHLGAALAAQGKAGEAVPVLEQALAGFHDTPPVIAFTDNRETLTVETTFLLAESLAKTGNIERARNLSESLVAGLESRLAKHPENKEVKADLAQCLVLLAGMLDPAKTEEAPRRQSLLDQASGILSRSDVQGRLTAGDKELMAKIESLRALAPRKPSG